ncbi:RNA-splicing ligase RtcB [Ascidiaceihabitans donghaensis]|uniref:3'-phosphate/5'-hydroxy nucleic acid ligase n=1 Tax=Ascidiaceihabitans donghaensis TaxID=1510460 RepID=A0A2R8B9S2_9RHOB|nr:RNA ligase RtcB family protein [Ascidiaceihabitans donghaensis]SPH19785.1 RNA-splicing ligase RtcB [Ascidiaceihabitans donghaensis]
MGNSVLDGFVSAATRDAAIQKFYTSAAWIDGRAEEQLKHVSNWAGVQKIAAFPDLHPGKYGPVGCAVLADRIYPQLIGNDIGCGMALFQIDLPKRKFKLEKALRRMRMLGHDPSTDYSARLDETDARVLSFSKSLGTIGGGNHFCEVQTLATCEPDVGLDVGALYLLIHSGSRGYGTAVLADVPHDGFNGMHPDADATRAYLAGHDQAARWARLNRRIIAERAADALRTDVRLIADVPHNLLTRVGDGWLHRKGAAQADAGLVPLAGSRATPSYLLRPSHTEAALWSTAHGSGRRYDRSSMHGRVGTKRSDLEAMQRTSFGGRVICEDRALLIEEAPLAYKSAAAVAADLKATGVAKTVATFHPLLTFKKTRTGGLRNA